MKNWRAKATLTLVLIALAVLVLGGGGGAIGGTSPIPDTGLRVLITYDETTRANLPVGQRRILDSTELRAWLDAKCTTDDKGGHGWRIWPDDEDALNDDPVMAKLLTFAKDKDQWLVVADGKRGTSEPLPPDLAAVFSKLAPYGGAK